MSAFDAVDGASSAASKWYRMIASKPERFKEVMPGNEMAFEVFKELARTRCERSESNCHAHVWSPARTLGQSRWPHHGAHERGVRRLGKRPASDRIER